MATASLQHGPLYWSCTMRLCAVCRRMTPSAVLRTCARLWRRRLSGALICRLRPRVTLQITMRRLSDAWTDREYISGGGRWATVNRCSAGAVHARGRGLMDDLDFMCEIAV